MVGHQTKCMDTMPETFNSLLQQQVEAGTILIIGKNGLAVVTTQDSVVQCSWIKESWFPSHEARLSEE
jgi:hypothetical protein